MTHSPSMFGGGDRSPMAMGKQQSADPLTRSKGGGNYLVPSMSEPQPRHFRTSSERLRKNSSTDTEYSQLPYHVIKQSSNDTTTSMTGSFNVEGGTAGTSYDLSVDSVTLDNVNETPPLRRSPLPLHRIHPNTDSDSEPIQAFQKTTTTSNTTTISKESNVSIPMPPFNTTTMRLLMQESSSTSTDESKEERAAAMPTISSLVVQSEIAKLSSTIKSGSSSTETYNVDGETRPASNTEDNICDSGKKDTSNNETMC